MSDMSMLTILIQASALVKNKSGDSLIHGYVEMQEFPPLNSEEADFISLNCLTHILVQNTQVLAVSYDDSTRFTIVMPNSESDDHYESQNSDSFDMELPLPEFVSSVNVNSIRSINAAVIPNPNDHNNQQLSGPLGQI